MACQPVPTSTIFGQVVETLQSTSTTFVTETTTIPAATSTSTFTVCLASATPSGGAASCISETISFSTTTISESTTTRTATVTTLIPYTTTRTAPRSTLFSTCSRGGTPSVGTTSTTTTLPNGSPTVIVSTVTTTPTSSPSSGDLNNDGNGSKSTNIGAIVGGSVGGFLGLLAIIIGFMCWRRSKRWDDIFEKDIGHGIGDDDDRTTVPQLTPAPYQYGMVGHTPPQTAHSGSTGTSPGLVPLQNPHSRVSSFGASAYSRDSTVPLTSQMDTNAPYMYAGRPTSYPPAVIPAHHPAPNSPPERPMSVISSTVSSLTQSQAPGGFYVANASPEDGSVQRPVSDVIPPSNGGHHAPPQPIPAPVLSEKQLYQQQQQAAAAGSSQAGASGAPVLRNDGRSGSQDADADAPPAYIQ